MILDGLRNRGIQYGIAASLLWHSLWIFVIAIDVSDPEHSGRRDIAINFMGPVLTDDAFNLIVSGLPRISDSEYALPDSFGEALEPRKVQMQRYVPNGLNSLSLGRSTWQELSDFVSTDKPIAAMDVAAELQIEGLRSPFPISGGLSERKVVNVPLMQNSKSIKENFSEAIDAEYELLVSGSGDVIDVLRRVSSGNPELDNYWIRYLKSWKFESLNGVDILNQSGIISIPADALVCKAGCNDNR